MTDTNHLSITKVEASQEQKEVTVNHALDVIDAVLNTAVIDRDLTTPPGSPTEGNLYIPASTATGAWAGHEGKIAHYTGGVWQFITPNEGLTIWIADEDVLSTYTGSSWNSGSGGSNNYNNLSLVGINTTADATNKLAVSSDAILFTRATDDVQVKLNKQTASDNASFLFQTNFNGFAELGLAGDNDFHFKVSPDNFTTSYESFIIDKDNGKVNFKQDATFEKNLKIDRFLRIPAASELTISSGVVTVTQTHHKIDTQSDASSDNLDTINGGTEGDIIILESANAGRDITIRHNIGNIRNKNTSNQVMDDYGKAFIYFYDGTNWIQL